MQKSTNQKLIGELYILSEVALWGLFPIIATKTTRVMPPLLFAGISALVAGISLIFYIAYTRQFAVIKNKKILLYILGATIFIAVLPQIFIFIGTSKTSSINTGILLQTEVVFTFIICGLLRYEKITMQKIFGGALIILIGASTTLYHGEFKINWGDVFIITGTAFFPIGNIFTKKALARATPSVVLFVRSMLGGVTLIGLSLLFEQYATPMKEYIFANLHVILFNGIVIFGISKLLWYLGLRHLDISKAIPIGLSAPGFTLIYAFLFLREIPTVYQLGGFMIMVIGLFVLMRQRTAHVIEAM